MDQNELYYQKLTDYDDELEELNETIREKLQEIDERTSTGLVLSEIELRRMLEERCLRKLGILSYAARIFHPLSSFGKMTLAAMQQFKEGYEARAGLLTTLITMENLERFEALIPPDRREDIRFEKRQAVGALRFRKDGVYAAGVMTFYIDTDPVMNDPVLRIDWIYVSEEFREQQVATLLLCDLFGKAASVGITCLCAEIPKDSENVDQLRSMFSDWHFRLEEGLSPVFYSRLSDLMSNKIVRALSANAKPFEYISYEEQVMIKEVFRKIDPNLDALLEKVPPNFHDRMLSCACFENRRGAILLAHHLPSGLTHVDYLGCTPGCEEQLKNVVSWFLFGTVGRYRGDRLVSVPIVAEELGSFFDEHFKNHLRVPVWQAMLQTPDEQEDVDPETAENILTQSL